MNEFRRLTEYPGIRIYRDGRIIRDSDEREMGSLSNSGYMTCTFTRADGNRAGVGRNRLVAKAYCPCPGNYDDYEVNHKDRVKTNDAADNLEWLTPRENLLHAALSPRGSAKFKPMQLRNFDTGEVLYFDCMLSCARYLGIGKDTVQLRCKSGGIVVFEDRNMYRYDCGDSPWRKHPVSAFVLVKDTHTGEVTRCVDSAHAARFMNVSPAYVSVWIRSKERPLTKGRYLFMREQDRSPWRVIDDLVMDAAIWDRTQPVEAFNPETQELKRFSSSADCCRAMGLKPSALNMRLKSGKPEKVYLDGFQYRYIVRQDSNVLTEFPLTAGNP